MRPKCPCCGSDDAGGCPIISMVCWDCSACFYEIGGGLMVTACSCGKHDEGKIIKEVDSAQTNP